MKVLCNFSSQGKPNLLKTFPIKVNNFPRKANDILEAYCGPHQTSVIELFLKTVSGFTKKL